MNTVPSRLMVEASRIAGGYGDYGKARNCATKLAADVRAHFNLQATDQADVLLICKEFGIALHVLEAWSGTGTATPGTGETPPKITFRALSRSGLPRTKEERNLILAHELAHLLVRNRTEMGTESEEYFCDVFAVSLVLGPSVEVPRSNCQPELGLFEASFPSSSPLLTEPELAAKMGVSLDALLWAKDGFPPESRMKRIHGW